MRQRALRARVAAFDRAQHVALVVAQAHALVVAQLVAFAVGPDTDFAQLALVHWVQALARAQEIHAGAELLLDALALEMDTPLVHSLVLVAAVS